MNRYVSTRLFTLLVTMIYSTLSGAATMPGKGVIVQPVQSPIPEETFQTLIVSKALEQLGYTVKPIQQVDYNVAYTSIANGDATFMAVNWDPVHTDKYETSGGDKAFYRKGYLIKGAAQGYLIDKKTAQKYNITNIEQLKDPRIAKLFDANGDGKADLAGCNPGWGCESVIEHQMKAYGLSDTVTVNQGQYSAIIANTITRFKEGKSVLYYTWTPYWVSGIMVPGKDVVWLEVPFSSLPGARRNVDTALPNGKNYGFQTNSLRIVANKKFAHDNPAAAKLFAIMNIDINDVSAENSMIAKGDSSDGDLQAHANGWIKSHQKIFNQWLKTAREQAK